MQIKHLISDADGVLINSQKLAWKNAHKIISLFYEVEPFKNLSEFKKHFSRDAQVGLVGEMESDTLRSMHRLLMRHQSKEIKCFHEVIEVYKKTKTTKTIVTSAFASGIRTILGEDVTVFSDILGRETGRKGDILKSLGSGKEIYVTDSVRDVLICKNIGIPVIATGWGYDSPDHINAHNPDYFVSTPSELNILFHKLNLN